MTLSEERDKERILINCSDCNKLIDISYGRYRRTKDKPHRCKECHKKNMSINMKNMSEEDKKRRSDTLKLRYKNLSDEEKEAHAERSRKRWKFMTPDEIEKAMKNTRKASNEYNRRPETREKLAKRNKDRWNRLSQEEKDKELERLSKIRDDAWNNLSLEEKYIKMKKLWDSLNKVGPTEIIFNEILQTLGLEINKDYIWSYSSFPFIHPEFIEKFGDINPISKEINFPYHNWDFKLFPNTNNQILIDVDGSSHSPNNMHFSFNGNKYTEREQIDYRDSQRPYQIPDNHKAYIIKAYNDKITDNTVICSITNKDEIYIMKEFKKLIINLNNIKRSTTIEPLQ